MGYLSIAKRLVRQRSSPFFKLYSTSKEANLSRTRNVGIIAHIDAGKTTVTERLLYLSGATRHIGDVDSGNTVTDFLDIERERGITVQSAAVSFPWRDHKINLIDTPGHVDFTVEVERCARVLDGVVTVLDSCAGIQAQTLTVWRQAAKFGLPATFFVNKMDKRNADFNMSIDSIEQKLGVKSLVTVGPVYQNDHLVGFVDVIRSTFLDLEEESSGWQTIGAEPSMYLDAYRKTKENLCFSLSDCDSPFMTSFLEANDGQTERMVADDLIQALHRVTMSRKGAPVSCGTALRSTESVRPVLDQIVDFLPSPEVSIEQLKSVFGTDLSAFIFKIAHDKRKGQLSYVRVYTGQLRNNTSVFNSSRGKSEGPLRLFVPQSDHLASADVVGEGGIAVVSGLKSTITGDTLIASESVNNHALELLKDSKSKGENAFGVGVHREGSNIVFSGIDVPEPVYFCCVEPPSSAAIHDFEKALGELAVEDPSMRVRRDTDTGQTVIETMGELHLDVIKDRFLRGYGLDVFIGPLQIGYREIIGQSIEHTASVEDKQGEKSRSHSASVTLHLEPADSIKTFKRLSVDLPAGSRHPRAEWVKALSEGCANALHNGPVLGFPLQQVNVSLRDLVVSGGKVNPAILSACAHKCVSEALTLAGAHLVEPVMRVEIVLEDGEGTQSLLQELGKRRAQIDTCASSAGGGTTLIAYLPLAEMQGLSSVVRTLSSGLGALHVQVSEYSVVSEHDQAAILAKIRGY